MIMKEYCANASAGATEDPAPRGAGRYEGKCPVPGCGGRLWYKKRNLCLRCGRKEWAGPAMKEVVDRFSTPFEYNRLLFETYSGALNPAEAGEPQYHILNSFSKFLASFEVPAPLTWEYVEGLDPRELGFSRSTAGLILTALRRTGDLLSACEPPQIELLSAYKSRRAAFAQLRNAPPFIRRAAEEYARHLKEEKEHSDRNLGHHLSAVLELGRWCEAAGIRSLSELQPPMILGHVRTVRFAWECGACQNRLPYAGGQEYSGLPCAVCRGEKFRKVRRCSEGHVRGVIYRLKSFFAWARDKKQVIINPAAGLKPRPAAEPNRWHLPADEDRRIVEFMRSPEARPHEALLIYLLGFHGLRVCEIRRALVPPETSNPAVRKSLADAYAIIIPPPESGPRAASPGRRVEFLEEAGGWLKPALRAFERERERGLAGRPGRYLFVARHGRSGKVGVHYVDAVLRRVSEKLFGAGTTITPGLLHATWRDDLLRRGGPSALTVGSCSARQAYAYTPAPRSARRVSGAGPKVKRP